MERPLGAAPFATQSRRQHALTVIGGVLVCWLAYFGAVALVYDSLSVLALETAIEPQRVGTTAAGIAVWGYFGLAFVRGYGGPVLNAIPYPLAILTLAPFPARWLLFGPDVSGLISRFVGWFVIEPMITVAHGVLPGFGLFVLILTVWASVIGEDARENWERTHLSRAFYDEFVDVDSRE